MVVILYMYDHLNGHRYRKLSYEYYLRVAHSPQIVSAKIFGEGCHED